MSLREWPRSDDENGRVPERRATPFGGTVAVLVAVLAGVALGAANGTMRPVLGGLAGAVVVALGVRAVQSETNARRAVGSVGIVAGVSGLAGVAVLDGGGLALLVGSAVAAAAVNATVAFDERVERPAGQALWRSATVLSIGAVVAVLTYSGALGTVLRVGTAGAVDVATSSLLAMLVVLQLELLAVVELLHWTVPVLDRWLPEHRDVRAATLDRFDVRFEDVPRAYWAALGLQVLLALSSWGPAWFAGFLETMSVFGRAVGLVLATGVLHVPLAVLLVGLAAVLVARGLQVLFVGWAGTDPPRAVAYAAGGVGTFVAVGLLAVALPDPAGGLAGSVGADWAETVASVGLTATVAGSVAAVLFVVAAARRLVAVLVAPWVARDSAGGFTVAAAALVVASLAVADAGGSAFAVFGGVAGALVVHDLGTNAVGLGAQVGSEAETRAGEAAHAVGTLLVGAAGVVLAGLVAVLMGLVSPSPAAWRARLAVALLLVAVLCFAVLFERE
ncbi:MULTISPECIES: hypothetical protein [Halorussus]|uniref:DUF7519 family protein n=1 Tax=Halorussus TaxID=1070314 RepID=UPI000E214139|nr:MULTISPECIES: hypothetical protein [Halorussus]NHN61519.1 hypothetical protein [Halorussus sp. JP-T4]